MKKRIVIPLIMIILAGGAAWHWGVISPEGVDPAPVRMLVQRLKGEKETEQEVYKTETVKSGSVSVAITEDGTVTFGTKEQTFVLEGTTSDTSEASQTASSRSSQGSGTAAMNSASGQSGAQSSGSQSTGSSETSSSGTSLEIEEVYVRNGQVIEEGDSILRLTQESIDAYKSALESTITSAELTVQQEEINAESAKAAADYNYSIYIAEGTTAEATYEATLSSLDTAVSDVVEEMTEVQELIDEYTGYIESGYDYEDELAEQEEKYADLEDDLTLAENNRTTKSIEAKKTYEDAMTNYQYADQLYAIDTDGLEDDLNTANDALQAAKDALTEFEEAVGDGVLYSEYTGTISSISCQAGDTLAGGTTVMVITDPEDAAITVSVSQEDISYVTVGDTAKIILDAYPGEEFEGLVSSIETASSMGSSTVNYTVSVNFTGDVTKVYSGMTGEVTFGVQSEEDVLYVSNQAVYQDGTRIYVKVIDGDNHIEERDVSTGFSNGRFVEVIKGLALGETVVIESKVTQ